MEFVSRFVNLEEGSNVLERTVLFLNQNHKSWIREGQTEPLFLVCSDSFWPELIRRSQLLDMRGWFSGGHSLSTILRGFLNNLIVEWMRCGKRLMPLNVVVQSLPTCAQDGTDVKRHLFLGPEPDEASQQLNDGAWRISDGTLSWRVRLGPGSYKTFKIEMQGDNNDLAHETWLWEIYWDWHERFKPQVHFRSQGELYMSYRPPSPGNSPPHISLPPFLDKDSHHLHTWDEAVYWFVTFLNCGYAERIERCVYCDRYFARRRKAKRGIAYKRGAHCGECKATGSLARMKASRAREKDNHIAAASKAWANWKRSNRSPDQREWVARQVNKQFGTHYQRKWVSQNIHLICQPFAVPQNEIAKD